MGEKGFGRDAAKGKMGRIGKKFLTHGIFQGLNCAYSIGIEAKRRSDFLRMKSRELQANHGKESGIKEGNETEEDLWSRSDAEPGMFQGFWAAPRGEGAAW